MHDNDGRKWSRTVRLQKSDRNLLWGAVWRRRDNRWARGRDAAPHDKEEEEHQQHDFLGFGRCRGNKKTGTRLAQQKPRTSSFKEGREQACDESVLNDLNQTAGVPKTKLKYCASVILLLQNSHSPA